MKQAWLQNWIGGGDQGKYLKALANYRGWWQLIWVWTVRKWRCRTAGIKVKRRDPLAQSPVVEFHPSPRKERTAKATARALEQTNEVITIKMVAKPKHNQEIRPSGRPVEFLTWMRWGKDGEEEPTVRRDGKIIGMNRDALISIKLDTLLLIISLKSYWKMRVESHKRF